MQLELLHPEVAHRDCQQCLKYYFEEDGPLSGKMRLDREGNPLERPPGTAAPCRRAGMTCPKGTAENQVTISDANRKTWQYYRKCKLTGRWPEDEWLIEMSVLLDEVLRDIQASRQVRLLSGIMSMATTR